MSICIPIKAKTAAQAVSRIKAAAHHADFIEIWFDHFKDEEIARVIKSAKKPVIAVCRGKIERGNFRGSESVRIGRLIFAVKSGAKFVDVGIHTTPGLIGALRKTCKKYGAKMIISTHIWSNTPALPALLKICVRAQKLRADVIKIATYAKYWSDNVTLFELTRRVCAQNMKIIAIGMGEKGKISRLGCPILGSYLTYVALNKNSKTAPGQLMVKDMVS